LLRAQECRTRPSGEALRTSLVAARVARFTRLTFTPRPFAALLTFRAPGALRALAALKPRVAPLFARLTRLARFSGLPLVAPFAAFRTEPVAAAAIAATTEIPITTIAAIELLLAFALREIDVRLFAASLSCVSLTLAAFA